MVNGTTPKAVVMKIITPFDDRPDDYTLTSRTFTQHPSLLAPSAPSIPLRLPLPFPPFPLPSPLSDDIF